MKLCGIKRESKTNINQSYLYQTDHTCILLFPIVVAENLTVHNLGQSSMVYSVDIDQLEIDVRITHEFQKQRLLEAMWQSGTATVGSNHIIKNGY